MSEFRFGFIEDGCQLRTCKVAAASSRFGQAAGWAAGAETDAEPGIGTCRHLEGVRHEDLELRPEALRPGSADGGAPGRSGRRRINARW